MKKKRGKYGKLLRCIKCGHKAKRNNMATSGFDYAYCLDNIDCGDRIDRNLTRYMKWMKGKRGKQ